MEDDVDRIIEQWSAERPDLDTRSMEIFGRIYRLAEAMGRITASAYAEHGLTRGEFDVLATLRRSGKPYRLSPTQLARQTMVTTGGMTGRLDKLTQAGLVERIADDKDARRSDVKLTSPGRRLVEAALVAGVDAQAPLAGQLGADRARRLADDLRDLLALTEIRRDR